MASTTCATRALKEYRREQAEANSSDRWHTRSHRGRRARSRFRLPPTKVVKSVWPGGARSANMEEEKRVPDNVPTQTLRFETTIILSHRTSLSSRRFQPFGESTHITFHHHHHRCCNNITLAHPSCCRAAHIHTYTHSCPEGSRG